MINFTNLNEVFSGNEFDANRVFEALHQEAKQAASVKVAELNANPFKAIGAAELVKDRYDGFTGLLYLAFHLNNHRLDGHMDSSCGYLDLGVAVAQMLRMFLEFRDAPAEEGHEVPTELDVAQVLRSVEELLRQSGQGGH